MANIRKLGKIILSLFFSSVILGSVSTKATAQVEVTAMPETLLTQHWAMPTFLNPAATGDIDFIRIRGGARMEWLGSHDSPKNYLAAADSPFKVGGKRIGAGIIISSNSYYLYRNFLIGAQGSYKFRIKKSSLSVGIQIGYFHSKFKGSEYTYYNNTGNPGDENGGSASEEMLLSRTDDDPAGDAEEDFPDTPENQYPTQDVKGGTIDMSIGVRYEHKYFHLGLSVLHITNSKIDLTQNGEKTSDLQYIECKVPRTLYFEAGGNIGINNSLFTLQPSVLVGTDFSDFHGIAELRATYNQKVTFGVDYRWNNAVGVMAGLMLKNFFIGYNWEYDYKNRPYGSTGNHELVLGYQFKMDMGKGAKFAHRSIRIM